MQLILDAKSVIDINDKMATFQHEVLEDKIANGLDVHMPVDKKEQAETQDITKTDIYKPDITAESGDAAAVNTTNETINVVQDNNKHVTQLAEVEYKVIEPKEQQVLSKDNSESANDLANTSKNQAKPAPGTEKTTSNAIECLVSDFGHNNGSLSRHFETEQNIILNKNSEDAIANLSDEASDNDKTPERKNDSKNEFLIKANDNKIENSNRFETTGVNNTSTVNKIRNNIMCLSETNLEVLDISKDKNNETALCEDSNLINNTNEIFEPDMAFNDSNCHKDSNIKSDQAGCGDNNVNLEESAINNDYENTNEMVGDKTCKLDCDSVKDVSMEAEITIKKASEVLLNDDNDKIIADLRSSNDKTFKTNFIVNEVKGSPLTDDSGDAYNLNSAVEIKSASDIIKDDICLVDSCKNYSNIKETELVNAPEFLDDFASATNVAKRSQKDNMETVDISKEDKSSPSKLNDVDKKNKNISEIVDNTNIESITCSPSAISMDDTKKVTDPKHMEENTTSKVSDVLSKRDKSPESSPCKSNNVIDKEIIKKNYAAANTYIEKRTSIPAAIIENMETEEVADAKSIHENTTSELSDDLSKKDKSPENSPSKSNNFIDKEDIKKIDKTVDTCIEKKTSTLAAILENMETEEVIDTVSVQKNKTTNVSDDPSNKYNFHENSPSKLNNVINKENNKIIDTAGDACIEKNISSLAVIPESMETEGIIDAESVQENTTTSVSNDLFKKDTSPENSPCKSNNLIDKENVKKIDTAVDTYIDKSSSKPAAILENLNNENVIDAKSAQENATSKVLKSIDHSKEDETAKSPSRPSKIIIEDSQKISATVVDSNVECTTSTQAAKISADEIMDVDEVTDTTEKKDDVKTAPAPTSKITIKSKLFTKLSNTLDILSDDDEPCIEDSKTKEQPTAQKQCINLDDDDDIMLISEDASEQPTNVDAKNNKKDETIESETLTKKLESTETMPENKPLVAAEKGSILNALLRVNEKSKNEKKEIRDENKKPLIPENFLKTCKKNLIEMTRDDLEELCVLKIVESIVDRSFLSEIKTKLKTMAQSIDEYKTKTAALSKQNRDLQIVLKSVQEEQKKGLSTPIVPLKITRSVGLQVVMIDKPNRKRSAALPAAANNSQANMTTNANNRPNRSPITQAPRAQKLSNQQIPVPRLVPANNVASKTNATSSVNKVTAPVHVNAARGSPQKAAEKRPRSSNQSMTVDLTDDEPPAKLPSRASTAAPVRLVPAQNLLTPQRQAAQAMAQATTQSSNTPRKVYIPISGPQNSIRPGQAIVMKALPTPTPQRQRAPVAQQMVRLPQAPATVRIRGMRHPAPLPDAVKQYQPPNWKTLPPAPDLKLSKVENGIVISWKIEGYHEDSYEEIASYQLYAYQETSAQPSTALWKKIGDVKALPLPMACTLTQFMAGYKYYFAVRAVDVRSRFGPFSLPGSILLLNKT